MKIITINKFVLLALLAGLNISALFLNGCRHDASDRENKTAITAAKYHCPMHPAYISETPGNCPICGMRLVPIEEAVEPESADENGRATVALTNEKKQLSGVRTTPAKRRPLHKEIRASARVAYDPELYNTLLEYQQAMKVFKKSESSETDHENTGEKLLKSLSLRLWQMGLTEEESQSLITSNENLENFLTGAEGKRAWVYADIYENESALVKKRHRIDILFPAFPDRSFSGTVFAVDTVLNPQTRTLRVRAVIRDPEQVLKPEMFGEAVIYVDLGSALAVPSEAIINTGTRRLVFVETKQGVFEPREVRIGDSTGDFVEVISGIAEGDLVASSGNFLLDSESKMKAIFSENQANPPREGQSHD